MRSSFIAVLLIFLLQPAPAQERSYYIDRFHVTLEVREDATYAIEEAITFGFQGGTFSEGFRTIPARRIDEIRRADVQSPDAAITDLSFGREGSNYVFEWRYPARSEPITFVISYEVTGALIARDERNIIDWDAVGGAGEASINDLQVEVIWPGFGVLGDEIEYEPREEGTLENTAAGWAATFTRGELDAGVPYRIYVSFPQQMEGRVPSEMPASNILFGLLTFLVAMIPGIVALLRWRDPSPSSNDVPAKQPGRSIPEVGMLLTDSFTFASRVYPAVLLDLVRRGHITLRHVKEEHWTGTQEKLETDIHPLPKDSSDFEAAFMAELEKHDSFEAFTQSNWTFHAKTMKSTRERLVKGGLMIDNRSRSNRLFALSSVVAIGGIGLLMLTSGGVTALIVGLIGGAVAGLILAGSKRYDLTEKGAAEKAHAEGYLEKTRTQIESDLEADPVAAVRGLTNHLPWLLLDAKITGAWLKRFKEAMEESSADFDLPNWIKHAVGPDEDVELLTLLAVIILTQPRASSSGISTGSVSAGAGTSGGVGGGSVGVR